MNNQNERIAQAILDTDDALHEMEALILKVFTDNPDNKYSKDGIRLLTGVSKNIADYRVRTLHEKEFIEITGKEALPGNHGNVTCLYQLAKKRVGGRFFIHGPWV